MKNLVIIFGGRSVEHDISILTGLHAARHIVDGYTVHLVYLTHENRFVMGKRLGELEFYTAKKKKASECYFRRGNLYKKTAFGQKKVCSVHSVINCCHGGIGEDGRLSALLDIEGVPITSCDYTTAATLMSKLATRNTLNANSDFPQPKYLKIRGDKWTKNSGGVVEKIVKDIGFPAIIKPDKLGSSIGISVVKDCKQLDEAIELASTFGSCVIAEEFIQNAIEINCAAFRYGGKTWVSKCEKMNVCGDVGADGNQPAFLDFEKKYLDSSSGFIKKTSDEKEEETPEIAAIMDKIQRMTKTAYNLFEARGVVRCDFLVNPTEPRIILNEINTVPGFLSYHMWQWTGIPYGALLDMLVKQSLLDSKTDNVTVYQSDILEKNKSLVE